MLLKWGSPICKLSRHVVQPPGQVSAWFSAIGSPWKELSGSGEGILLPRFLEDDLFVGILINPADNIPRHVRM